MTDNVADNESSQSQPEWRDFREEIRRVQRGVRIMWAVNFLLLSLVYNAAIIVAMLDTYAETSEIIVFLMFSTGVSLVAALITMLIITRNSRKFIASGLGSSATEVQSGTQLHNIVEEIAIAAGMRETPRVFVSNDNVFNAYALSDHQGNAYVAITEPLVNALSRDEISAVMAHELAHVQEGDSPSMTKLIALSSVVALVASIGWRLMFYGNMSGGNRGGGNGGGGKPNPIAIVLIVVSLVFLILAPLFQKIAQSFMSRQRESRADRLAIKYTRDPTSLATALIKINEGSNTAAQNSSEAEKDAKKFNDTIGAVAFYQPTFLKKTFATHPPFEKRIEDLQAMGAIIE